MSGARRWWWVVVLPVVAALAAGAVVLQAEGPWSAVASIDPVLTGTSSQQGGGLDGDEYTAAFVAIATGTPVLEDVAEETDLTVDQVRDGLEVTRQGDSTGLRVRFEATSRDDVRPVLDAVTRLTLARVFQPDVDAAEDAVERATTALEQADAAVTEFGTRTGIADPPRAYQAQLGQINALDTRRADAVASGATAEAEEFAAQAAAAREALATFTPLLTEYDALTATRGTARDRLDRARERQETAAEQVAAADPASIVSVTEPRQDSTLLLVARTAAVAGAVALVLCLLLVSLLQAQARGRAQRAATRGADGE